MNIQTLVKEMTLKEKVGQLNQRLYGWEVYEKTPSGIQLTTKFKKEVARWGSLGFIYGVFRADPWSGKNHETGLTKIEAREVSLMIQQYLRDHTRLKIPVFLAEECPHGHQALESMTTPTNISVGASWNPELYSRVQALVAAELREKGAHLSLISTLDVARDPRWGRTEECFSEDPFLTGQFTMAALAGLQGQNPHQIAPNKSLAVLKHFAAQGATMGGHNAGPVTIGNRELREIHLLPMEYAIKGGVRLCMAAYNDIDGVPCHGNVQLLRSILREEFGFDGAVMADGCALDRLVALTGSPEKAAAWALKSGVDISLWDEVFPYLEQAVMKGLVNEAVLDQAVTRVLTLKKAMGLFENPTPEVESYSPNVKDRLNLALAKESIVLLKNKNKVLPLNMQSLKKLAVIGPNANQLYNQLGDYTPYKDEQVGVTLLQGLQQVFSQGDVRIEYEQGTTITEALPKGLARAIDIARDADVIIVALGGASTRNFTTEFDTNGAAITGSAEMTCGENIDLANIALPAVQQKLVRELSTLNKPLIAVLIQGRPHSLTEIDSLVDGLLIAGYPGELGGLAIAKLLVGKDSPSGKLAMSIPRSSMQLPVYYNYRQGAFKEDYLEMSGKALYPFGYGLSYSKFKIENLEVTKELKVQGTIQNLGTYKAAEVIQLYLRPKHSTVIPRVKALKGFAKIWLEPGETQNFTIALSDLELKDFVVRDGGPIQIEIHLEASDFHQQLDFML